MLSLPFATVIASAASSHGAGSESTPWDVLYVAAGMILFILLVSGLAATLNGRERRREEREQQEQREHRTERAEPEGPEEKAQR